jgi:hypothetical protein
MSAPDRLVDKARAYETLAASHEERAPVLGKDHAVVATGFIVAAIVLREVAAALDEEGRDRG